jgi:aminoglycoside phosphotransferase (APT) family kinase protein
MEAMNDSTLAPELRVARFLETAAGAVRVEVLRWERLSGGATRHDHALDVRVHGGEHAGERHWVVRSDAPSGVSPPCAQELALLRAARAARVKAPEVLWSCDDGAGPAFFVMERVPGVAAGDRLVKEDTLVPDRERLARDLGENLARLHLLRPPVAGLEFLGAPPADPALERVATYRARLVAMQGAGAFAVLERGLGWCEANAPAPGRAVLVHRNYRTGNYVVGQGRLAAVLDWECAGWGDPLEDLGWFLAPSWRFGRTDREAGGIGPAHDFLAGYQSISGRTVGFDETRYWQVMAQVRRAVSALPAHGVPELEAEILALTGMR